MRALATPSSATSDLSEKARELRRRVLAAVERSPCPGILLSGGLDTSIIAHLAAPRGLKSAVTVVLGGAAPDAPYASRIAERLGLEHRVVDPGLDGLLGEVPFVVRTMRTFDPMEVRNSVVVARALREARTLGLRSVYTGDAADELFGGYSFLWPKSEEEFARSSERMVQVMRFSSFPMGEALGVEVHAPFMDPAVVEFSRRLGKSEKVAEVDGTTHGKYLLRLAFPEVENRWRRKDPIEVGSGSRALTEYLGRRTSPGDFERERSAIQREEAIEIRDPEHLAYYRVFREVFGDHPPIPRCGADPCAKCGFELYSRESDFCVTCGAWPARLPHRP